MTTPCRILCLRDLRLLREPLPLVGAILIPREDLLHRMAFTAQGTERPPYLHSRLRTPLDQALTRKGYKVYDICFSFRRTIKLLITTQHQDTGRLDVISLTVFEPSERNKAAEKRKMEEDASYDPDERTPREKKKRGNTPRFFSTSTNNQTNA